MRWLSIRRAKIAQGLRRRLAKHGNDGDDCDGGAPTPFLSKLCSSEGFFLTLFGNAFYIP
jgi:hypothetical protein